MRMTASGRTTQSLGVFSVLLHSNCPLEGGVQHIPHEKDEEGVKSVSKDERNCISLEFFSE
jgi:hypothetical protein